MFDCVFPTRTARFGVALTRKGPLKLKHQEFEDDHIPIEVECGCFTCKTHTRSYLSRLIRQRETVGCHLISIHNIAYQMRLMRDIRVAIANDTFPEWTQEFMWKYYHERKRPYTLADDDVDGEGGKEDPGKTLNEQGYPQWIVNALHSVGVSLR